jgi:hypothetical protein
MFLPNSYSQKSISKPKLNISEEFESKKPFHKNSSVLYSREGPNTDGLLFGNSFLNNLSGTNKYNIQTSRRNSSEVIKENKFINNSSFDFLFSINQDKPQNLFKETIHAPSIVNKISYFSPSSTSTMIICGTSLQN